jgi:hypothetical protein
MNEQIKKALREIVTDIIVDGVVCPGHFGLPDFECIGDTDNQKCTKCWNIALELEDTDEN